jgi:hypothetical protein
VIQQTGFNLVVQHHKVPPFSRKKNLRGLRHFANGNER